MNVLVACEFSGTVRDAFRARGHNAWSCDLEPCESDTSFHIKGDVTQFLDRDIDLLIGHPLCTYLSRAGAVHLKRPGRKELREQAMAFFMRVWQTTARAVCVENPVGYPWQAFRRPDQIIQPYQFGHAEMKKTCLWMRGLPFLVPTCVVEPEIKWISPNGKKVYFTNSIPNVPDRWKIRSRTFKGIAEAMAEQWG